MLFRCLTIAALILRTTAQPDAELPNGDQNTTNSTARNSIAINEPSDSTSPMAFACQSCADTFSDCGIACLAPNLTWENIFRCQGYCKEVLCNGRIGPVSLCTSIVSTGLTSLAMSNCLQVQSVRRLAGAIYHLCLDRTSGSNDFLIHSTFVDREAL